jgi:hypothetical protein
MIADAVGIGLYGGTMLEGTVGTAASAHLFATFPALQWGTELFGPLLLTEDIVTSPLTYADFEDAGAHGRRPWHHAGRGQSRPFPPRPHHFHPCVSGGLSHAVQG